MKKIFSEIILFIISISFANAQMCVVDGLRYYAYSMTQASFAGIEDTALYSSVTSLKIPNTIKVDGSTKYVEKIKIEALYGFDYFEEITLPNGITSIEDYAFKNCSKLKTISMPNGMYSLGTGAFKGCSSLEKIDLSNTSIMQIPQECFYGCSSLDSLVIPKKANYLYDSAFAYCGIRYLEIENSNENIYEGVFAGCKNLETVVLPEQLRNLGNGTFADCSGLKRITLPNELTSIKANLFKNCSSLDSLELHPNITMIYTDDFGR
ncbi:MAG: leucine-rich repeat domain-containing protein [Paludibacteraceae bacterium]|nr:leucine-rich repeat domain-containing protein [Paludibacteraceae bacterium]